ncbi:MAG: DUF2628 domain-containing protein [Oscillospiraceae bacterium]|nr:DUF2628 domain-containing protein [Oscillospiraceae bacterium]
MMDNFRYTNERCPVCREAFTAQDDIVVCPLCGAPHHRECYKRNGECAYSDKHNEGFVWKPENEPAPESAPADTQPFGANQAYQPYANPANGQMPPFAAPAVPYVMPYQFPNPLSAFPPELEDGVSTADAATYINKNSQTYLHKFFKRKSGKRTFNFAAFFFGPYWFIYRKMYKLGAIFIAITLVLAIIPMLIPQYSHMQKELNSIAQEYQNFDATSTDDPIAAVNEMYSKMFSARKKHPIGIAVGVFSYAADIALSVYMGIVADKKYKEHVVKSVKEISSSDCAAGNEEFRRLKILGEGGTSLGFAILAAMAVTVVSNLLSMLNTFIIK